MNKTKTSKIELNKVDVSNLPNKEFKVMLIKMLSELGRIYEHSDNCNRAGKTKNNPQCLKI